jgi:hypothetical protein
MKFSSNQVKRCRFSRQTVPILMVSKKMRFYTRFETLNLFSTSYSANSSSSDVYSRTATVNWSGKTVAQRREALTTKQ